MASPNFRSMNLPKARKNHRSKNILNFYEGEGVQHIAVATKDIIKTVTDLKARGVEFLGAPPEAYYEMLPERVRRDR